MRVYLCVLFAALFAPIASAVELQLYGGGSTAAVQGTGGGAVSVPSQTNGSSVTMSNKLVGSEYGGSLMFHPFWPAPFAIGGFVMQQQYKGTQTGETESFKGTQYGPEAMIWAPIPFVQPYVRGGYTMGGSYAYNATAETAEGANAQASGAVQGYQAAGGIRIHLIPMVGLFLEADYARTKDKSPDLLMQSHTYVAGVGGHL